MEKNGYTRFEETRIISTRALQISMGAPLLIDAKANELDPVDLAEREFEKDLVPITVRRRMPPKLN